MKKAIRVSATKQENAVGLHCVLVGSAQKKHYMYIRESKTGPDVTIVKAWGGGGGRKVS